MFARAVTSSSASNNSSERSASPGILLALNDITRRPWTEGPA